MKHLELTRKLSLFFALALALPGAALAQQDFDDDADDVEEIVVTGSYIKGTPEDAPNPVSILTREDLLDQGSPTITEIVKSIGISSGVDGETNQFQSNGQEGAANINLRGLGPGRTLVLMNGKRSTYSGIAIGQSGYQQFVNINNIPVLAIERIEMLRDGASAIYGSDAVAGVANFLTRDTFEGLEIAFNHRMVSDSDGWNEAGIVWGQNFGPDSHLLLAFGYNTRSELEIADREWAIPTYTGFASLFHGWSSTGNPGGFVVGNNGAGTFSDPGCSAFGGLQTDPPGAATTLPKLGCRFQYTQYDNLIEDEQRYQFYAEWDTTFAGGSTLEITGLIANIEVPEWKTSPSYPPNSTSRNLVFGDHPGFVQLVNDVNAGNYDSELCRIGNGNGGQFVWVGKSPADACPASRNDLPDGSYGGYRLVSGNLVLDTYTRMSGGTSTGATSTVGDAHSMRFNGRYLGWGAEGPQLGSRTYDTLNFTYDYRFTMGANDDIDVVIQGGYGSQSTELVGADMLIQRFVMALRGFGGPNCVTSDEQVTDILAGNTPTGGIAKGTGNCMYYNPFSNALPRAYRGAGPANAPQGNTAPTAMVPNDPALLRWLWEPTPSVSDTTLLTTEAIFSGTFGNHGWAGGAQLRLETYDFTPSGFNDHTAYPCESEFITAADVAAGSTCGQGNRARAVYDLGVYAFLAPGVPFSRSETAISGFGEVELNLSDNLVLQVAGRFESYSEAGVSALTPKVSVRWDVFSGFSLRGSFGQSFKAPQLAQLGLNNATALSFIPAVATFKAVDTTTDPSGLDPESATNINLGLIFETAGLFLSFDYWTTELNDPILSEDHAAVVALVCPDHDGSPATARRCDPTHDLAHRINYNGVVLDTLSGFQNLSSEVLDRVRIFLINGDSISTGGYDINLRYSFADWTNPMELGFEWSHLDTYELTGRLDGLNVTTTDHVGQLNASDGAVRPLPADKYRFYWNMDIGGLRLGASYNLVSEYLDERTTFAGLAPVGTATIEAHGTFHFNATYKMNNDKTRVFVNIDNLLDKEPSFARTDLSYDAYTHSPLGQTLKFGFLHQF